MAEIFAAELRADAERLRSSSALPAPFEVAEGVAVVGARGRQLVVYIVGGKLHSFHRQLGRSAADDDRKVIRRARRGAERQHFFFKERQQRSCVRIDGVA